MRTTDEHIQLWGEEGDDIVLGRGAESFIIEGRDIELVIARMRELQQAVRDNA